MPTWKSNGHLTFTRVKIKLSCHFFEPVLFLHFLISLDSYSILPIVQGKNHELILFFFSLGERRIYYYLQQREHRRCLPKQYSISWNHPFLFSPLSCVLRHVRYQFPNQRSNLHPLQGKYSVLTTRTPGKPLELSLIPFLTYLTWTLWANPILTIETGSEHV